MIKKVLTAIVFVGLIASPVLAQGNGQGNGMGNQYGMGNGNGQGNGQGNRGGHGGGFNGGMASLLLSLPVETLSADEETGLVYMREEEKLARDVYLTLYNTWNTPIFHNIARSEQRHMDGIKVLLDKYNLQDPMTVDTVGIFSDPKLQTLYTDLVTAGSVSALEALKVGATIEDLDIFDLKRFLATADNSDVKTLYQNLMKGSRNHLRSFITLLTGYGESYTAQHLTQQEVDDILNTPHERGILDEDGNPLYGNTGW